MLFVAAWLAQSVQSFWIWLTAEVPLPVLAFLVIAIIVGVILIRISLLLKTRRKKRGEETGAISELIRDVGIAFLVSVLVTALIELHVRTITDNHRLGAILNTAFNYNLPEPVWTVVNQDILNCDRIRTNVSINFDIQQNNKLPSCATFLIMEYSYDLYSLRPESAQLDVTHTRDTYSTQGGFDYAKVTDSRGKLLMEKAFDDRENRDQFSEQFTLLPGCDPSNHSLIPEKAIRVMTKRHEVMSLPGNYILGMPFLVMGPIKVSVNVPKEMNVEPKIETQWAQHKFERDPNAPNSWIYTGVLVPGQFIELKLNEKTRQRRVTTQ